MDFFKKNILNIKQIKSIESNIDSLILGLSEIYPRFAYELNGQHRISEKIRSLKPDLADKDGLHLNKKAYDILDILLLKKMEEIYD